MRNARDEPYCLMEYEFGSAKELLDHLLEEYKPERVIDTMAAGQVGFVFRGQTDARWFLLPKVHRVGDSSLSDYAPQAIAYPTPGNDRERRHNLGDRVFEEFHGVHRFIEEADRLGFQTPLDYSQFSVSSTRVSDLCRRRNYASDYPHRDSDFPNSVAPIRNRDDPLSDAAKVQILGGTAAKFYGV
jgi:hypothetical protein